MACFLYLGTWIPKRDKSRMSVLRDKDTRMWQITYVSILGPGYKDCAKNVFQYFGIHASLYGSPAREPGGFPYIKLAFGCFSPIWPTKRRRGETNIHTNPPFHFAGYIEKTGYMKIFKGSPLCPVGHIANLPLGPTNCTMPPLCVPAPQQSQNTKTSKTFCLQRHWQ